MKFQQKSIANSKMSPKLFSIVMVSIVFCLPGQLVFAQTTTYRIQPDDHLQISFWQSPELNTEALVSKDGGFEIPVIGRITTAGLTINQFREKIISQMALYNKLITQLSITVLEYGHNRVYVTGHVGTPGKYSFEEIPGLWDIILEAGGPAETALLDEVVIVRSESGGQLIKADVSNAIRSGGLSQLPEIKPGDTVHVPGTSETGTTPSPLVKKDQIYILGAVAVPGAHKFEAGLNLLEVIGEAGGPTPDANLKRVKHVSVSYGTTSVVEFDLEKYIDASIPTPMPIGAGDTIFIPRRRGISPILNLVITSLITATITSTVFILIR